MITIEMQPARRSSVVSIKIDDASVPLVEVRNAPLPNGASRVAKVAAKALGACTMLYAAYSIVTWIAPRVIYQADHVGFYNQPRFDFDR